MRAGKGRGEAGNGRQGFGPAAPAGFLPATGQKRRGVQAGAEQQRPNPFGATKLMRGKRHGIGGAKRKGQAAGHLHRIQMH